jgi:predicted RNA-binding Zn-ribbon protein involved in translation (DUF1610 family)
MSDETAKESSKPQIETPKVDIVTSKVEKLSELEELRAKRDKIKIEYENAKKAVKRVKSKEVEATQTIPKPSETSSETAKAETGTHESPTHFSAWQQFCPECGDKNPNFKDEVHCTNCGMHLGSVENVAKLKVCPSCGVKPDFKDETVCKTCGFHLGAVENLQKLSACPRCGGHGAKRI